MQVQSGVGVENLREDVAQRADVERIQELEVEQKRYRYVRAVPSKVFPLLFSVEGVDARTDDSPQDSHQAVDCLSELVDRVQLLDQEEIKLEDDV